MVKIYIRDSGWKIHNPTNAMSRASDTMVQLSTFQTELSNRNQTSFASTSSWEYVSAAYSRVDAAKPIQTKNANAVHSNIHLFKKIYNLFIFYH